MAAALLDDEKAGNLALHVRCYYDSARLRQRLDSRRSVRCITVNLTCRIDDYRAGFDTDARVQRGLARSCIIPVHFGERGLDRKRRSRRTLSIVLMGDRIPEERH